MRSPVFSHSPLLNILLAISLMAAGSYSCSHGEHDGHHSGAGIETAGAHDADTGHPGDIARGCPLEDNDGASHNHADHCPCICHIPASLSETSFPMATARSYTHRFFHASVLAPGHRARVERPPQQA